jgi:hypothetical protein
MQRVNLTKLIYSWFIYQRIQYPRLKAVAINGWMTSEQ